MATNGGEVSDRTDNSFSMKLMVNSIKAKFPYAVNISTQMVHTWLTQSRQSRGLIILVSMIVNVTTS